MCRSLLFVLTMVLSVAWNHFVFFIWDSEFRRFFTDPNSSYTCPCDVVSYIRTHNQRAGCSLHRKRCLLTFQAVSRNMNRFHTSSEASLGSPVRIATTSVLVFVLVLFLKRPSANQRASASQHDFVSSRSARYDHETLDLVLQRASEPLRSRVCGQPAVDGCGPHQQLSLPVD